MAGEGVVVRVRAIPRSVGAMSCRPVIAGWHQWMDQRPVRRGVFLGGVLTVEEVSDGNPNQQRAVSLVSPRRQIVEAAGEILVEQDDYPLFSNAGSFWCHDGLTPIVIG